MVYRTKPLNAVMVGLSSILFTGLGLIIVSMKIGFESSFGTSFRYISYGVLGFGVVLILIGVFGILGTSKQIRKSIAEGKFSMEQTPTHIDPKSTRIIRQQMPEPVLSQKYPQQKPKLVSAEPKVTSETLQSKPKPKPKPVESSTDEPPTLSLDEALNAIITNYNLEKVKKSFKGWNETLVMRFPDLGKNYLYIINGSEGIEFKEGSDPNAAVQVEMDSKLFQKLIAKEVNAIKAYSSGKMNVQGQMKNMLKLRKLMF
jgi:putative sterol carrier protein